MNRTANLIALLVMLSCTATAPEDDSVKLSGFWIRGVTIESMGDGRVVYITAAGTEISRPLAEVESIKLALYPDVEQALNALEARDHDKAIELFTAVKTKTPQPWVKQYVNWHLVGALARTGRPVDAVASYAELVGSNADPHFLAGPPVEAVALAGPDQKSRIIAALRRHLAELDAAARKHLEPLLDAARTADAGKAGSKPPHPGEPRGQTDDSAVRLPRDLPPSAVADLLRAGRFADALHAVNQELTKPGRMSEKLYLKGITQLGLAEASGDLFEYKSAGLSFMKSAIYFPKPGGRYLGPSRLEAAYVHSKIGRSDKAKQLFEQAGRLIDAESDPDYHKRMLELIAATE